MAKVRMPHPKHEDHLCYLQNVGFISDNWEDYKELVRDGQYVCKACGRVAGSDKNLCVPEEL